MCPVGRCLDLLRRPPPTQFRQRLLTGRTALAFAAEPAVGASSHGRGPVQTGQRVIQIHGVPGGPEGLAREPHLHPLGFREKEAEPDLCSERNASGVQSSQGAAAVDRPGPEGGAGDRGAGRGLKEGRGWSQGAWATPLPLGLGSPGHQQEAQGPAHGPPSHSSPIPSPMRTHRLEPPERLVCSGPQRSLDARLDEGPWAGSVPAVLASAIVPVPGPAGLQP